MGVTRSTRGMNSTALHYSREDGAGSFIFPDKDGLMEYRVAACTLMTSGKLYAVGAAQSFHPLVCGRGGPCHRG